MSISNASKKAPRPEDVPAPGLSDLAVESNLRAAGVPFTVSVDRRGRRALGAVFPVQQAASEAEWEAELKDLSRQQGLDADGHSEERQRARERQEEPVADPATTTRTLRRRG